MADKKKKKVTGKAKETKPKTAAKKTRTAKPIKKAKPSAKATAVKKSTVKKTTPKKTASKRASTSPVSKRMQAKPHKATKKTEKPLKPDRNFETSVNDDKSKININITPKRQPKPKTAEQPINATVTKRAGRVSSITYHIRYD